MQQPWEILPLTLHQNKSQMNGNVFFLIFILFFSLESIEEIVEKIRQSGKMQTERRLRLRCTLEVGSGAFLEYCWLEGWMGWAGLSIECEAEHSLLYVTMT